MSANPVAVGRVFSVWNWPRGRYSYFLDPSPASTPAAQAVKPQPGLALGMAPEAAMPTVPPGARFVGWGDIAVGTVARLPGAS